MRCTVCFRYGEDSRAPRRVLWTDVTVAERHGRRLFESAADDIFNGHGTPQLPFENG